jgi:ArsR family transcriptional regulator
VTRLLELWRCMVDKKTSSYWQTAQLFRLLAHPDRLSILDELRRRDEACVCHLQAILKQRQPYVSQHLRVLRDAGVAKSRRDGTFIYYRLTEPTLVQVLDVTLGPAGMPRHPSACTCPECQPENAPVPASPEGTMNSRANTHAFTGSRKSAA